MIQTKISSPTGVLKIITNLSDSDNIAGNDNKSNSSSDQQDYNVLNINSSSSTSQRRKFINPLYRAQNYRKQHMLLKRGISATSQRIISAKFLRVKTLQNELVEAQRKISDLQTENRVLKCLQKRQDVALQKYEAQDARLPQLINSHEEEIRIITAKYKQLRINYKRLEKQFKSKSADFDEIKIRYDRLLLLSRDKNLPEREKLVKHQEEMRAIINEQKDKIKLLMRRLELEVKNYKYQLSAEMAKYKMVQNEYHNAKESITRLETLLKERRKYEINSAPIRSKSTGPSVNRCSSFLSIIPPLHRYPVKSQNGNRNNNNNNNNSEEDPQNHVLIQSDVSALTINKNSENNILRERRNITPIVKNNGKSLLKNRKMSIDSDSKSIASRKTSITSECKSTSSLNQEIIVSCQSEDAKHLGEIAKLSNETSEQVSIVKYCVDTVPNGKTNISTSKINEANMEEQSLKPLKIFKTRFGTEGENGNTDVVEVCYEVEEEVKSLSDSESDIYINESPKLKDKLDSTVSWLELHEKIDLENKTANQKLDKYCNSATNLNEKQNEGTLAEDQKAALLLALREIDMGKDDDSKVTFKTDLIRCNTNSELLNSELLPVKSKKNNVKNKHAIQPSLHK